MAKTDTYGLKPLLRRALAGDPCAWNDFFQQIRRYLHAEARKVLGPGPHGPLEASDLVQSALRRIWERIGDQFPDGPEDPALPRFLGWVQTIVRNRSLQECRKKRPRANAEGGAVVEHLPDRRPQDQAAKRDRVAVELAAALGRLPEKQRQVVELFWFERLSDAQICERLGGSVGAVRVVRCRALRALRTPKLRALLEESHDDRC
jgi:RNA polymerase sigma-70 factor (ECF subfamily)